MWSSQTIYMFWSHRSILRCRYILWKKLSSSSIGLLKYYPKRKPSVKNSHKLNKTNSKPALTWTQRPPAHWDDIMQLMFNKTHHVFKWKPAHGQNTYSSIGRSTPESRLSLMQNWNSKSKCACTRSVSWSVTSTAQMLVFMLVVCSYLCCAGIFIL